DDDALSLGRRLAELGAQLLVETLPRWAAGEIGPRPQEAALATYAPKLAHDDGRLDWTRPADELARRVRAYRAWPTAYTTLRGEPLKILAAEAAAGAAAVPAPPGTLLFPARSGRRLGAPAVATG